MPVLAMPGLNPYFMPMDNDSTDIPEGTSAPVVQAGPALDLPPQDPLAQDVDATTTAVDDDAEARLPEIVDAGGEAVPEGPLAVGRAAIE